ncbi:hypothetical protein DWW91_10910 [Parabacteroides sp. AF17-3]|uniref:hypothetical protein n=1 Tax=Parabacteroides sp. AF17-3 TaxID=2293113 RepID=UPI000EFF096A|nr:hypothetical protein [Parabacteroides sp. AF17-3]RKU69503.1 hypothetical protein DWW91_10910 [Parabacteroides sp. AF17-3]
MLEKAMFWKQESSIYTSELNSVNSIFTKLIKRLEKIRTKVLTAKAKNSKQISKLTTENNKLLDIDDSIQAQIKKYEGMMI